MIQVQVPPAGPYKFSPSSVPLPGPTEGFQSQLSWLPHPGKESFWAGGEMLLQQKSCMELALMG